MDQEKLPKIYTAERNVIYLPRSSKNKNELQWSTELLPQQAEAAAVFLSGIEFLNMISGDSGPDGRARSVINLIQGEGYDLGNPVGIFVSPDSDARSLVLEKLTNTLKENLKQKNQNWLSESTNMNLAVTGMLEALETLLR
ncbi:MAG: hypothetical protein WAV40_02480 [Microgenomates group bacterium]